MESGTIQSPGKSIIPFPTLYKREAGDGGAVAQAAAPARSSGCGFKRSWFKVTGSLSNIINQDFLTGLLVLSRTKCIECPEEV